MKEHDRPQAARLLLLCFLLTCAISCSVTRDSGRDVQAAKGAIRRQIAKYTAALDAADTAIATQVWLTSPDVSFISPAGHFRGWEQVKGVYQYFGSAFSERKLTVRDISVHVNGDAAWAEFYWHFAAKLRSNGSPMQTDGRETQIYQKDRDRWALVHVHYSGMPATP